MQLNKQKNNNQIRGNKLAKRKSIFGSYHIRIRRTVVTNEFAYPPVKIK